MTYIKNNKVLVFVIAVLLLSNIAMLYFFLRTGSGEKPKKDSGGGMRAYMIKTLRDSVGFTDEQITKYEALSDKHKEAIKPLFEEMTKAKDSLYKLLLKQPSDSLVSHYLGMIGEKQKAIDQRIFNHFIALKEICTAEQRPRYDSAIQRVIKGMITFPRKGKDKDHK